MMKFGVAMFPADYAINVVDLGRAAALERHLMWFTLLPRDDPPGVATNRHTGAAIANRCHWRARASPPRRRANRA